MSLATTLQTAYTNGRTINISTGFPVEIKGASGKLLRIFGDIEVTGVIDPTGIELTPQVASPLPTGDRGIWVKSNNHLIYNDSTQEHDLTKDIEDLQSGVGVLALSRNLNNSTGSNIPKGTPVYLVSANEISPAMGIGSASARVVGITVEEILDGSSGPVAYAGIIKDYPGTYTHGSYLWLDETAGSVTDIPPSLALGYPVGFNQVILGVVSGDDLIIQITHFAIL